jgi:hypothetical protein
VYQCCHQCLVPSLVYQRGRLPPPLSGAAPCPVSSFRYCASSSGVCICGCAYLEYCLYDRFILLSLLRYLSLQYVACTSYVSYCVSRPGLVRFCFSNTMLLVS